MKKDKFRIKNPDYDKIRYQEKKEYYKALRAKNNDSEKNKEWRKNNPDKVKQYNDYHRGLLNQKKYERRKKELDYDNFEWFPIPNIRLPYFINIEGVIIDKHFKKISVGKDKAGYSKISLGGKGYLYHRIVAIVFIPNVENKPEINHKNGDKTDNRIENLEWSTRSENIRHAFDVLKKKSNFIGWWDKKKKNTNSSDS